MSVPLPRMMKNTSFNGGSYEITGNFFDGGCYGHQYYFNWNIGCHSASSELEEETQNYEEPRQNLPPVCNWHETMPLSIGSMWLQSLIRKITKYLSIMAMAVQLQVTGHDRGRKNCCAPMIIHRESASLLRFLQNVFDLKGSAGTSRDRSC